MRSLIDILSLSTDEIDELIAKAEDIIANPEKYREKSENYIDEIFHKAPPFEHPAGISVSMRIMQTIFFIFSFLSFNG